MSNDSLPIMMKHESHRPSPRKVHNRSLSMSTSSTSSSFSPPSSVSTQRGRARSRRPSTPPPTSSPSTPMATVPTAIVTPDSSPTQTRPSIPTRQETSSTGRSLSSHVNLRPREGDNTSHEMIPEHHILLIRKAFGRQPDDDFHCDVDLYADVLQVDRSASPKDIRIAYFRRGREVLAFGKDQQLQRSGIAVLSPTSFNQVAITETAKLRFQAVSLAYEILSTPSWKRYYDKY